MSIFFAYYTSKGLWESLSSSHHSTFLLLGLQAVLLLCLVAERRIVTTAIPQLLSEPYQLTLVPEALFAGHMASG